MKTLATIMLIALVGSAYTATATRCSMKCVTCAGDPGVCTKCDADFQLDSSTSGKGCKTMAIADCSVEGTTAGNCGWCKNTHYLSGATPGVCTTLTGITGTKPATCVAFHTTQATAPTAYGADPASTVACQFCKNSFTDNGATESCGTTTGVDAKCELYEGGAAATAATPICARCASGNVSGAYTAGTAVTCAAQGDALKGCAYKSSDTVCAQCHTGMNMGEVGKCSSFAKIASAFALIALFFANF